MMGSASTLSTPSAATPRSPKVAFIGTGGAARGLAHLGVLKACEELGVIPEIFVGASAGAIVGATYGQGIPLDVLLDGYRLPWKRRHDGPRLHYRQFFGAPTWDTVKDPGHLAAGLFSIDKLERYLAAQLPENDFRRLRHRVLVTAVDIDRAERVVFGRGYDERTPISQAVAASCCVPLLFRPYAIGGRYHLDGEVARTLSADLAVEAGAEVLIVSSIYRPSHRQPKRSVARRGAFQVINQSLNILLTEKEQRGLSLYHLKYPHVRIIDVAPDIGSFGYLNRFAVRSLVMRGYSAGLRALAAAKEQGVFEPRAHAAAS